MMKTNTLKENKNQITMNQIIKIFLVTLFVSTTAFSQVEDCKAELKLVNDKPNKQAGVSGTTYRMKLTNTGAKTEFEISLYETKQLNAKNSNAVDVDNKLIDFYLKEIKKSFSKRGNKEEVYKVLLNKGEEYIFYIKLTNPNGAKIGSKYTTQINVTSSKCSNLDLSKVLNTEFIYGD